MDSAPCDLVIESLDSGCHGISTMPAHSPLIRCGSSIGLCVQGVHELTRRRCPEIRADFGCEPLCPVEDTTANGDLHVRAGLDISDRIDQDPDVRRI